MELESLSKRSSNTDKKNDDEQSDFIPKKA